tara:strand:- start:28 stop:2328 length:2301 start_codon:yes stop_codon:yes gene_type:complete
MSTVSDRASAIYAAGVQPWPVNHNGTKAPRLGGWSQTELPERLNEAETMQMFQDDDTGLGVICGKVSGNLELFEFEGRFVNSDGYNEFLSRCQDEGLGELLSQLQAGYEALSPSGGIHLMLRTQGPALGNTKLARRPATPEELQYNPQETSKVLIETRGEGGFAVFMGSNGKVHPSGGSWSRRDGGPRTIATITTQERDALYELASSFDEMPDVKPHLGLPGGTVGDDDLAQHITTEIGIATLLHEDGWHSPFAKRNGRIEWTRPGKESRDGGSLEQFPDGGCNIYTTTHNEAWTAAILTGSAFDHVTPIGVLAAVRFKGDISAAMSWTRKQITGTPKIETETGLGLPTEFWDARPTFTHIRNAAWASMTVPEALLGSALSRYAAMIPPAVKLPAIIGAKATLDYITCVVAESSGGKTISNGAAAEILSGQTLSKKVDFDAPIGSGEGVIQAFMGYELNDKGKKMGDPSYKFGQYKGIHFTADEGTAITEAQKRSGTTLVQTLCSAWSGSTLGQLNASIETKRRIPGGKRRVAATINIQTALASELFESQLVGLPKRMVFFWAHGEFPDTLPEHPGDLRVGGQNNFWDRANDETMTVASEVCDELRAHRRVVAAGTERQDDLDGHRGLLKLKTAALLALMEDRMNVTTDDWDLAEMIMKHSDRVRSHVLAVKRSSDSRSADAKTMSLAEREATIDDVKERKAIDRLRDSIIRKVAQGPIATNKLARATTAAGTRHRFEDALSAALADGRIEVVNTPDGNGTLVQES